MLEGYEDTSRRRRLDFGCRFTDCRLQMAAVDGGAAARAGIGRQFQPAQFLRLSHYNGR